MAKYKLFNVAAYMDKDEIFFNFMVELEDKNDTAVIDEVQKCIADVFSPNYDEGFSFRIVEDKNPPSKKMFFDENARFSKDSLVNFKEELSAIGIILKANSELFKKCKLVNAAFDYVARTGTGYNSRIINTSKIHLGKYKVNFIYSKCFPPVDSITL